MSLKYKLNFLLCLLIIANLTACTRSCQKNEIAERVFFVEPANNSIHKSQAPIKIIFGLEGKTLKPAGEDVLEQTSGHHHILLNNSLGHIPAGHVVPSHANNIHFGKAEAETELRLKPGKHKLSLQFADGAHLSYGKSMAESIEIVVIE